MTHNIDLLPDISNDRKMSILQAHLVNGGTLVSLAELWDANVSTILNWVYADVERTKLFNQAMDNRREYLKERIYSELFAVAFSDIRKLFDKEGRLLDPHMWPEGTAQAVQSIEVQDLFEGYGKERQHIGFTKKVRFWSKDKAVEMLAKHLSMLIEKHEHTGKVTLEDLVVGSAKQIKDVGAGITEADNGGEEED